MEDPLIHRTGNMEGRYIHWNGYYIAGNFREVQIFAIFATHDQNAKIKTAKIKQLKFCTREKFSNVRFVHQSRCLTMALHRYFKPSDDLLPSPTGLFRPL